MAFVPGYDHDIFVSYAVVDNGQPLGNHYGWVSSFVDQLKHELARALGRSDSFDVWLDRDRLSCGDIFSTEIETALQRSALLVVLYSKGYLASPWCARERKTFVQAAGSNSIEQRIFLAEIDQVENDDRPKELKRLHYLKFWEKPIHDEPQRLGAPIPNPKWESHQPFYIQIGSLARQIARQLETMKSARNVPSPATPVSSPVEERPTVFLAESTDDVVSVRNEVIAYLDQFNIDVVPKDPLSANLEAAQQQIGSYWDQAWVYAQILGKMPGERPEQSQETYVELQWRLAQEAEINKPKLQWCSPDLRIESVRDAGHRALLQGSSVRQEEPEFFKKAILDEIQKIQRQREKEAERQAQTDKTSQEHPSPQNDHSLVFVNHTSLDQHSADQICEVLREKNIGAVLPILEGTPEELSQDFEENMILCSGVIVVYGEAPVSWVRQQLRDVIKRTVIGRKRFHPWWVVEGPPPYKDSLGMQYPGLLIVNCRNGNMEEQLASLLNEIS